MNNIKRFYVFNECKIDGLDTAFRCAHEQIFAGFVVDRSNLTCRFVVDLLIDGFSVKTRRADEFVDELAQQGVGDGSYGFSFHLQDEIMCGAHIAEARIANLGTLIGAPIHLRRPSSNGRKGLGQGSVRWVGGLRFLGWLSGECEDLCVDIVVDGEVVKQVMASGWTHIGVDPETARAVRAFDFHLLENFADGQAHLLEVVKRNGDHLPGCPVSFVAFADGLKKALSGLGTLESEQSRVEYFDRLLPMSTPFSEYSAWRERFPIKVVGRIATRLAVIMVGNGNIDDTVDSLHKQTLNNWVAASFPDVPGTSNFEPKQIREFLTSEAEDADLVLFSLSGTKLTPTALERVCSAFIKFDRAQAVYGDIDIVASDNSIWPLAFSAFDYEKLLEQGYCAHLFALRRATADQALASGASTLYRLFNCILEHGTTSPFDIVHVPGPLAALRAFDVDTKQKELRAATIMHLEARGVVANVTATESGVMPAVRVSRHDVSVRTTIIVPTRNHYKLLKTCIESIQPAVKLRAAEIIIVDNDSTDAETLEYLATLDGNVARVLRVGGEFNFSRLNNLAARVAAGDALCLLNNDIEALDDKWLDEMLGRLSGPDVGAVGALLLWPSRIVQHGGVVLGPGFAATHAFIDRVAGDVGYGDLLCVAHECSAVTAACLVTRRSDFIDVGGMDELRFPVNFNDVDYCLKLRAAGKRIVFTPHAKLLHLESVSRGSDKAPERKPRYERELQNLRTKWGQILVADCYYNPMLSLDPIPFSALAWPPRDMTPRIVTKPRPVVAPPGI